MARKRSHSSHGSPNRPRFWGKHAVAAALDNPERRVLKAWTTLEAAESMNFPKDLVVMRADGPDLGTHGAGRIVKLTNAGAAVNPDTMLVSYLTSANGAPPVQAAFRVPLDAVRHAALISALWPQLRSAAGAPRQFARQQ